MGLFDNFPSPKEAPSSDQPLAERMRPRTLEEFVNQEHLLGPGKPLYSLLKHGRLSSMILWGPPGSGKTTLAQLIARYVQADFISLSAVLSGIREVKSVMETAQRNKRLGRTTVLFIDEIHRFNKAQQDAFLPYVERGDIILIGATTENPSFEVIPALLSRCRVYRLRALTTEEIVILLKRALQDKERGLGNLGIQADDKLLEKIAIYSDGDARTAYNVLETAVSLLEGNQLTEQAVEAALQRKVLLYDKAGEEHFNLISALHKSLRASDVDAALYWLGRMLEAGEDRLYIARRLVRIALEDVGLADPRAIEQAIACMQAVHFLGIPEGDLALAQLAIYLAVAPKSDACYKAMQQVSLDVQTTINEPVPLYLRNPVTSLMKQFGYGEGYEHAHEFEEAIPGMECLPESLRGRRYYIPSGRGYEEWIQRRLEEIAAIRKKHQAEKKH